MKNKYLFLKRVYKNTLILIEKNKKYYSYGVDNEIYNNYNINKLYINNIIVKSNNILIINYYENNNYYKYYLICYIKKILYKINVAIVKNL